MNKDESIDPLLRRTARTRAGTAPQGDCLDAETLAAWTDGSLTAVQRSAAETHAADCDRCLSVLAAIARTNPPPSATQRPAWLSFRWLVPLTTAAVAITAWILIQEPSRPSPPPAATAAAPAVKPAGTDRCARARRQRAGSRGRCLRRRLGGPRRHARRIRFSRDGPRSQRTRNNA